MAVPVPQPASIIDNLDFCLLMPPPLSTMPPRRPMA